MTDPLAKEPKNFSTPLKLAPFVDTADIVTNAALRARIHYVDVAAEQLSVGKTLEKFDASAREAGTAVVPSMGYFGGLYEANHRHNVGPIQNVAPRPTVTMSTGCLLRVSPPS